MSRKYQPACPCCCDCWLNINIPTFVADTGTWTRTSNSASTTSSNARMRASKSHANWQILKIIFTHSVAGEWVQVGFTDGPSHANRVYLRLRAVSATRTLEIEYRQTLAGVDSLIASQSITTTFLVPTLSLNMSLFYDPDYGTITGLAHWAGVFRNLRQNHTVTSARYAYLETETITGTTLISGASTRRCYSPDACPGAGTCQTDRAPHEWEIDLSGVALGDPVYGYGGWYSNLNAIHVPYSEGGFLANPYWRMPDTYGVESVIWRVTAAWMAYSQTLVANCGLYELIATMNPDYVSKPVLVLTITLAVGDFQASWAAIVEADWDSDPSSSYYGEEHVMTPDLFPAVCRFDWRTISQKRMTFVCSKNPGIDFSNSDLYLTARP